MGAIKEISGQLVAEAEDFDNSIIRSSHEWQSTSPTDAVGTALKALPDSGANFHTSAVDNSPELQYLCRFEQTGTYHVWMRGWPISSGNTCHVGLNGAISPTGLGMEGPVSGGLIWFKDGATVEVPSVGEHTFSIWMREDGMTVDRFVLTTDAGFTPTGTGPAVTGRHVEGPPPGTVVMTEVERDGLVDDADATIITLNGAIADVTEARAFLAGLPVTE